VPNVTTPPSLSAPPWSAAPTPSGGGNLFGAANAGVGMQSEFTRILGRVAVPPPPPIAIQPPTPAAAPGTEAPKAKSMLPLIIALSAVILLSVAIVGYLVLRK
jgi:hypothetical protein